MKSLCLFVFLLITAACVKKEEENKSETGAINASAPYIWSDRVFPKTIQISDDFTAAETTNLTDMADAWEDALQDRRDFFSFGARTPEISHTVSSLDDLYDGVLGIYKASQWPSDISGSALAVTQLFGRRYNVGSSSEYVAIEHADILINTDIHMFDTADSGPGYDLRTVVFHEMGHFLGLQHKDYNFPRDQSVMYPSIFSYENKRVPKQTDFNDMARKYGISISSGSGLGSVSQGTGPDYTPQDAGKSVKILIELHADGKCVHKVDGATVRHHHVSLK